MLVDGVDVVEVLSDADAFLELREDGGKETRLSEHINAFGRALRENDLAELARSSLQGDVPDIFGMRLYCDESFRIYGPVSFTSMYVEGIARPVFPHKGLFGKGRRRAEFGIETDGAKHTEGIFTESIMGIADRADGFVGDILLPTKGIDELVVCRKCDRIYGEVAASEVFFDVLYKGNP